MFLRLLHRKGLGGNGNISRTETNKPTSLNHSVDNDSIETVASESEGDSVSHKLPSTTTMTTMYDTSNENSSAANNGNFSAANNENSSAANNGNFSATQALFPFWFRCCCPSLFGISSEMKEDIVEIKQNISVMQQNISVMQQNIARMSGGGDQNVVRRTVAKTGEIETNDNNTGHDRLPTVNEETKTGDIENATAAAVAVDSLAPSSHGSLEDHFASHGQFNNGLRSHSGSDAAVTSRGTDSTMSPLEGENIVLLEPENP